MKSEMVVQYTVFVLNSDRLQLNNSNNNVKLFQTKCYESVAAHFDKYMNGMRWEKEPEIHIACVK